MQHDLRRIDSGKLRDQGEKSVPQRKRIAGVQSAVRELVDRADVQRAEGVELAHAPEVEERIAVHHSGDVPKGDPEQKTDERDAEGVPRGRTGHDARS